MQLIIDIGNSGAKVAVACNNRLVAVERYGQLTPEVLQSLIAQYRPTVAIYSSVTAGQIDWGNQLKTLIDKVIIFDHNTPIPIKNGYESPETLGSDRLAAAVGANFLFPATDCLIIDSGTAITIDYVSRLGEFLGGNISPGLQTRFKALNAFTGRLPLGAVVDNIPPLGTNTLAAVTAGVLQGTLYEIESYINKNPHCKVIFTGGDALFFAKNIKNPIFVTFNLVLIGLNRIVNYNVHFI